MNMARFAEEDLVIDGCEKVLHVDFCDLAFKRGKTPKKNHDEICIFHEPEYDEYIMLRWITHSDPKEAINDKDLKHREVMSPAELADFMLTIKDGDPELYELINEPWLKSGRKSFEEIDAEAQ